MAEKSYNEKYQDFLESDGAKMIDQYIRDFIKNKVVVTTEVNPSYDLQTFLVSEVGSGAKISADTKVTLKD